VYQDDQILEELSNSDIGILVFDEDGKILFANRFVREIPGLERIHSIDEVLKESEFHSKRSLDRNASGFELLFSTKSGETVKFLPLSFETKKRKKLFLLLPFEKSRELKALSYEHEVIMNSPAVVFVWRREPKWPVSFVSKNVLSVFGYRVEDFLCNNIRYADIVHPEDLPRVKREVEHNTASGVDHFSHQPYRIITKQGKELWVDDRTYIQRSESGEVLSYKGVVVDITNKVKGLQKLEFSNVLLATHAEVVKLLSFEKNSFSIYKKICGLMLKIPGIRGSLLMILSEDPEAGVLIRSGDTQEFTAERVREAIIDPKSVFQSNVVFHRLIVDGKPKGIFGLVLKKDARTESIKDFVETVGLDISMFLEKGYRMNIYETIVENTGTAMIILEENAIISFANRKACELFCFKSKEVENKRSFAEFIDEKDLPRLKKFHFQRRSDPRSVPESYEFTLIDANKAKRRVFATSSMIPGTKKSVISLIDATKQKAMEERLRKKYELQRVLIDAITEVLKEKLSPTVYQKLLESSVRVVPGAQAGALLMKNGEAYRFVALVGYNEELYSVYFRPEEMVQDGSRRIQIITDFTVDEKLDEERRRILYSSGRVGEIKVTLSIPIVVFDEIVAYFNLDNFEQTDAFDEDSVEIAEIFAKLTGVLFQRFHFEEELKKQKELAEYQSFHDSLTGLPNRRMLLEESEKILALAKRKQKPVTMMYLDLYKFKEINDSFGHNTGDEVLKVVANRLKKPLRRSDLVGRIGGDEFITVLPETSADQAKALALRLIEVIEEPIEVGNRTFNISVNIGISQYPENGDSFGKLIHAADVALYKAKKEKKAYCIFERP